MWSALWSASDTSRRCWPRTRCPTCGCRSVALAIGLPVTWAGIALRLWAVHTLGRYFRGVVHVQEGHQVVRNGPYRAVRHPAYSGALLAVVGLSLTYHNYAAIGVFVACVLGGVLHRIRIEERVLLTGLGKPYQDYAATTARLVPGIW